ncbi:protein POF1B isoform X1 [Parambassis ranga]|uniref:Protein POF1B isoform X1 n=2 Tax=Parambassis ranga TaxID=210632 RepID=A0A6P7JNR0_9TELE|nr:protein POF1B isoform X1 [Parambassis ranga]
MSVQTSQKRTTTTYRTVRLASDEPVPGTLISERTGSPVQPVAQVSQVSQMATLPYAMNGSYETVRYLVPMQQQQQQQQQQQYVFMQQPMMQVQQPMMQVQQPMMQVQQPMIPIQQPLMQQMVSPMYLQTLPRLSVSSQGSDLLYQQQVESVSGKSSVFSQSSSPIKSPEPSVEEEEEEEVEEEEEEEEDEGLVEVEEVEIVNVIQQKPLPVIEKMSRSEVRTELREVPEPTKLDTRYFGELLADVYRKNCDIHSCISDHVSKIRGQKHHLDPCNDYKMDKEEVEALIPKGATELTKQQMRYLLQTRLTADKSMRLLLSTFSSLREELMHMSEDLRRLEGEKESLERDLSFKADQARQYDCLLEAVRENNRQLQLSLKEASTTQRSLESQLMSSRSTDSNREFKMKELEGRMRALEKENEMLRQKLAGQSSNTTLHIKTEELSRQYNEQLSSMRREKDQEIERLRTQVTRIQTEVSTDRSSSEKSLQLKISELLVLLEQRQTTITRQEEEIKKLMQERNNSSKNVTKTIITKRYRNQYPILGLLSDDYQATSPVKEAKTIVIERTGEMIKQEIITTP